MQKVLTMVSEFDENLATVLIAVPPPQSAAGYKAIHEFHGAVMPQKQLLGEGRNSGTRAAGQTLYGEKKLVLVRFDTFGTGSFLAEMQELPDTAPEFGELPKARF